MKVRMCHQEKPKCNERFPLRWDDVKNCEGVYECATWPDTGCRLIVITERNENGPLYLCFTGPEKRDLYVWNCREGNYRRTGEELYLQLKSPHT